jgi:hypothetical protein
MALEERDAKQTRRPVGFDPDRPSAGRWKDAVRVLH